jgi:CrcB protein
MNFYTLTVVGFGGLLGSVTRYLISLSIQSRIEHGFPFGTFTVNILGCFMIGILIGISISKPVSLPENMKLFLSTGFLGGFTTFSAFSAETLALVDKGDMSIAFLYATLSVFLGLLATWAGIILIR